jgi:hypothetical protein
MWHAWERREKRTRFWWESRKTRDHSENRDVDEKMGLEWISREIVWVGDVEFIQLAAQDRGRWRAVMNTVMNRGVMAPRS